MNNPTDKTDFFGEKGLTFAMMTVSSIARAVNGNPPPGETDEQYVARMTKIYIGHEDLLLEAYSVSVSYLLDVIDETVGEGAGQNAISRFVGYVMGKPEDELPALSPELDDAAKMDARLAVLGTVRTLLEDGSDDDLRALNVMTADAMLPEAVNFLCWALQKIGDVDEQLRLLTQAVLTKAVD